MPKAEALRRCYKLTCIAGRPSSICDLVSDTSSGLVSEGEPPAAAAQLSAPARLHVLGAAVQSTLKHRLPEVQNTPKSRLLTARPPRCWRKWRTPARTRTAGGTRKTVVGLREARGGTGLRTSPCRSSSSQASPIAATLALPLS